MTTLQAAISKARKLSKTFGIVTPGGPLSKERTELGYQNIRSLGYTLQAPLEPYAYYADYTYEFTNGSRKERLTSIEQAINNPEVDVLLAARGVTGSLEIISDFPFKVLGTQKKLLIGQSDVSSFLIQTPFRSGIPSIHGPTLGAEFADYTNSGDAKDSIDTLIKLISDPDFRLDIPGRSVKKGHSLQGRLLAGNLTTLVSLLGTPYDVDYSNCILLLEEVGEAPYKIKRMLFQLLLAGKLDALSGLCFGRFAKCESPNGPDVDSVMDKFISDTLSPFPYPVLKELPVGHWGKSLPIPIGCMALIKDDLLCILESPIE